MKYCKKCNVSVNNPLERCPLCYATLLKKDNVPEQVSYPHLQVKAEKYNIMLRILLFLSLTVSCSCITINLLTTPHLPWSLLVVGNILYMWISIGTAIRKRTRIGFNIMIQLLSLEGMLMLLNWFTGSAYHWLLDYALPALCFTATLSITLIVIVKHMAIRDFILYFFLIALLGFIPIILVFIGMIHVLWPALVSALYSALSMVSIFIFADSATKIELKKRFHI